LPRLEGFADLSYANLNPRIFPENDQFTTTWSVGGQATWTINEIVTTNASARGLDAKTASVKAQKNALFDGVRSEIAQGQQSLKDAEAELETSARGLRAAEESYRVRRELFHNGRATSVELTDAETDLLRARLDAINARVDLRVAKVRFDHAVGADVH
jgi:outer membrane protein